MINNIFYIVLALLAVLLIIIAFSIKITQYYCNKIYKKQLNLYTQKITITSATEENTATAIANKKYICIYAYYEKNITYLKNFQFFLRNGILPNIDYYFVINGECSFSIDDFLKDIDIHYLIIKRENTGYDFGAWSCVINSLKKKYDYYVFINASVRGPLNRTTSTNSKNWLSEYLQLFNTKDIRLVGISINIYMAKYLYIKKILQHNPPYSHVQSMFFILDYEGVQFLKQKQFFNKQFNTYHEVVVNKEIKMSQLLLNNGWNINCFESNHKNYDYRKIKKPINALFDISKKENTIFIKHKSDNDTLRIIIAKYNEDMTWAAKLKNAIIYNKGSALNIDVKGIVIPLPNVGREGHTYYKYIYDNYEDLSDYTMFLQGNPFEHYNMNDNFFAGIRQQIKKNNLKKFTPLGRVLYCKISGCKYHAGLPIKKVYRYLFKKKPFPIMPFKFVQGAQFIVSKKQILKRPKQFYLNIIQLLEKEKNAIEGYVIERLHKLILGI